MRLIDADLQIDVCKKIIAEEWNHRVAPLSWADAEETFLDRLYEAPTVDAVDTEPIKHGHWITHNEGNPFEIYGECSRCGCSQSISDHLNYCPDCGAKMDEENNR